MWKQRMFGVAEGRVERGRGSETNRSISHSVAQIPTRTSYSSFLDYAVNIRKKNAQKFIIGM